MHQACRSQGLAAAGARRPPAPCAPCAALARRLPSLPLPARTPSPPLPPCHLLQTHFGQAVSVVGSFTGWKQPVKLEWTEGSVWSGEAEVPVGCVCSACSGCSASGAVLQLGLQAGHHRQ